MLILSRKPNQGFSIGADINVTVREMTEGENVVLLVITPTEVLEHTKGANGVVEIAEDISLKVFSVTARRVKLGIEAPKGMVIDRR